MGKKTHFEKCNILQYDDITKGTKVVDETVTIVQVDYGVKIVEAETMMGAIFGLGFIHAKDRLWQMNFYRHLV